MAETGDSHAPLASATAPGDKTAAAPTSSVQPTLARSSSMESKTSVAQYQSEGDNAFSTFVTTMAVEDETTGVTATTMHGPAVTAAVAPSVPAPEQVEEHHTTFLGEYMAHLFILFITMLLLNVLTLLYMYVGYEESKERPPNDKTLPFSMDKESVLWQPLVCVHRCTTELPYHKYPNDGLCDLLYLQLHADRPVAQTRLAPCYKEFSKLAKFARITRHGLLIHRSQSNASYWQLKTEEGMFEFVTLWANKIRSYGLGDLFLNTSASTDELGLHLPLIMRLREMQSLLDDMTGKYVERRYMLLDVRTSYTYPAADLVTLSKLLHAAMEFPIDLLLLRTHLPEEGSKPCMVLGPTTSVRAAAMDAVDVPIMSESAVMASHAKPPDYVTVLLSFSARTLYFNVPTTWSLGMPCDNMAEPQSFSEVCYDLPKPVTKDGIEKAWFLKSSRRKPPQVITFDDNSTIWPKMKLVYKLYTGKRLGWAIDDVEYDVDGTECYKATPLVQVVAQGRPDRFPHLP